MTPECTTDSQAGLAIQTGCQVTLHFSLKLCNGELIDSTFNARPAQLLVGDGSLPAGFEQYLTGLRAGQQATFSVAPEHAFGERNDNNVHTFARSHFASGMELARGMIIGFGDAGGGELPGVVKSYNELSVLVDFNHPLAGKTVLFEVSIISVSAKDL